MSEFRERVYALTAQIPPGRVSTYGAIAAFAGQPRSARAVGQALSQLQPDTTVPWQRVVNAQGKVSPRADEGPHAFFQRRLLEREGIVFGADDRIDLRRFGWHGPDAQA